MCKSNRHLVILVLLSSVMAGCVGVSVLGVTECESSIPICDYNYSKTLWGPRQTPKGNGLPEPNFLLSKDEFIRTWGEPSETIVLSDEEVTLVYKGPDVWCGVFVVYGLWPAPLIVPACETFDRITFKGNNASHLHFKRESKTSLIVGAIMVANVPTACPKPCPPLSEDSKQSPLQVDPELK